MEIIEANAGILGGTNIDFFNLYTKEVFDFIKNNKTKIDMLEGKEVSYVNTIFEQYFFYKLALKHKIDVEYLFRHKVDSNFSELVRFSSLPYTKTYIHTIGFHKKSYNIGTKVSHRLWYEYPDYYYRILKIIENENR